MRVGECMRGMSVRGCKWNMQVGFLVVLQRLELIELIEAQGVEVGI